ncbi:hypothetical protein [Nocardia sp. SC052]|uniref:hypothetical protein n=1 Tax=Nocardia sichangensis TaxID=3385975 RepID=UPI0039A10D91
MREDERSAGYTGELQDIERQTSALPRTGAVETDMGSSTGPGSALLLGAMLPMIAQQAEMRRLADQDLNKRRAALDRPDLDHYQGSVAAATTAPVSGVMTPVSATAASAPR